jgi:predicted DNA binding protein
MRALAERSGFDGDEFLALVTSDSAADIGPLTGLDESLALTEEEMTALALAYTYGRDDE